MRTLTIITFAFLTILSVSCVQKTHKRIVVVTLDASSVNNIKKVGIRGWDAPLSWDTDYPLKEIVKDSLYQAMIIGKTGRLCTEFKFSINDKLELENKENRKLYFDTKSDTTIVSFVFDK